MGGAHFWRVVLVILSSFIQFCLLATCAVRETKVLCCFCYSFTRGILQYERGNKGSKTPLSGLKCAIPEFGLLLNCDNVERYLTRRQNSTHTHTHTHTHARCVHGDVLWIWSLFRFFCPFFTINVNFGIQLSISVSIHCSYSCKPVVWDIVYRLKGT